LYDSLWQAGQQHAILRLLYPHVLRHFRSEYYYWIKLHQGNWAMFFANFDNGIAHWQGSHNSLYCKRARDCQRDGVLPRGHACIGLLRQLMSVAVNAVRASPALWPANKDHW
jgi:hypothetical protein